MKILLIADSLSPFTVDWVNYLCGTGSLEVHLLSSRKTNDDGCFSERLASFGSFPLGMKRWYPTEQPHSKPVSGHSKSKLGEYARWVARTVRLSLGPAETVAYSRAFRQRVIQIDPHVIHAMRLPFEGYMATYAMRKDRFPIVCSIWGNDIERFAKKYWQLGWFTKRTLRRSDALHADCKRDISLAIEFGFSHSKPTLVAPTNGGMTELWFQPSGDFDRVKSRTRLALPQDKVIVANARGIRPYIRNDLFYHAIPRVLADSPNVHFVCAAQAGNPQSEMFVRELGLSENVTLLPSLSRAEMRELLVASDISVSPSEIDGTPNSLLESMASQAFPVVSDLESIREWIQPNVNGMLCRLSVESIAQSILIAIESSEFRSRACDMNLATVTNQCAQANVMPSVLDIYEEIRNK